MSDVETRRQLAALNLEDRCADVCSGCGLHMILDLDERIRWLWDGGTAVCVGCGLEKNREVKKSPVLEAEPSATLAEPLQSIAASSVSREGSNREFNSPDGGQVMDEWMAAFNKAIAEEGAR